MPVPDGLMVICSLISEPLNHIFLQINGLAAALHKVYLYAAPVVPHNFHLLTAAAGLFKELGDELPLR